MILKSSLINTKLGSMYVVSDDEKLFMLEFVDQKNLNIHVKKLSKIAIITSHITNPIKMIEEEMELYFSGKLKKFQTPIHILGSEFQRKAWNALIEIPYSKTISYLQQAEKIGNNKAFRAVANANGANYMAIIIPCHRVINSNGKLGGYAGGIERKKWLIEHEKEHNKFSV
ncbi:methylated-DNA--[protein]-cysteine S-methyltransferase [Candidatus Cytomitobacter indipagum]|uniref:methylated-DNA--[protein]-cysteine S-methyltransferase n=2 Tax=Candidatus Cytomitobacter indipagum TaxID=2601575 RepID=A0A5C0UE46_9PROT|nr:methylated-DNA--[protein]-cysteine S-methyltransferase [Candidatus Cytomitobacter indipagum]